MPDFVVKDSQGNVISDGMHQICFAPLWYCDKGFRDKAHTLTYFPQLQGGYGGYPSVSRENALRFYQELKKTNFKISQTPEEILDKGYHIKFEDFRKKAGHISIVEVVGTLAVLRYVEECRPLVHKFLNLIDLYPEVDRWKALFATGFLNKVKGSLDVSGEFNSNHCISNAYSIIRPVKQWEQVEEAFESQETAWTGSHPGMQRHFGIENGNLPKINVINTKEDFQEFESQCSN